MSRHLFDTTFVGGAYSLRSSGNSFLSLTCAGPPFVRLSLNLIYSFLCIFNFLLYLYAFKNAYCYQFVFFNYNFKCIFVLKPMPNVYYFKLNLYVFNASFCLFLSVVKYCTYLYFCKMLSVPYNSLFTILLNIIFNDGSS